MTIIKKSVNMLESMWRKGDSLALLEGMELCKELEGCIGIYTLPGIKQLARVKLQHRSQCSVSVL